MNLNGSRNSGLLSWVLSVRLGISGFEEENLPFDPPKSVFGGGDPSPTVTGIGSARVVWAGGSFPEFPWTPLTRTSHIRYYEDFTTQEEDTPPRFFSLLRNGGLDFLVMDYLGMPSNQVMEEEGVRN